MNVMQLKQGDSQYMVKLLRQQRRKGVHLLAFAALLAAMIVGGMPAPAFADNWQPEYYGQLVSQNSLPGRPMCLTNQGWYMDQTSCQNLPRQLWTITPVGDGYYSRITSTFNGGCLDVYAYNHDNGATVDTWPCIDGASNQEWRVGWTAHGFTLQPHHAIYDNWGSGKCLDVYAYSHDSGSGSDFLGQVVQWDCLGGVNQLWGPAAGL
jgi:Ricin-type beta-trefoil lectin domain-like